MNARARILMTFEDYLDWESRQEEKFEYVNGEPVLRRALRGMAGGTRSHSRVAGRLVTAINTRLPETGSCEAFTSDFKIQSPTGNVRYPDAMVDCGRGDDEDLVATEPTLVAEVLSRSNSDQDIEQRLIDYKAVPSVRHILMMDQRQPHVELWTRRGEAWRRTSVEGWDAALDLPALDLSIPLTEIYRKAAD